MSPGRDGPDTHQGLATERGPLLCEHPLAICTNRKRKPERMPQTAPPSLSPACAWSLSGWEEGPWGHAWMLILWPFCFSHWPPAATASLLPAWATAQTQPFTLQTAPRGTPQTGSSRGGTASSTGLGSPHTATSCAWTKRATWRPVASQRWNRRSVAGTAAFSRRQLRVSAPPLPPQRTRASRRPAGKPGTAWTLWITSHPRTS